MTRTHAALRRLGAPIRREIWLAAAALALGVGALVVGGGAWLARAGWIGAPTAVLVTWLLATVAALVAVVIAGRWSRSVQTRRFARALEATGQWRRGALLAHLEQVQDGASIELAGVADGTRADELRHHGPSARAAAFGWVGGRLRGATALLAAGTATVASAAFAGGSAGAFWDPARAFRASVAPVQIEASSNAVDRGDSVRFVVAAYGRRDATLWLRTPGETWRPVRLELDAEGRGVWWSQRLETDLFARATSGGHASRTLAVHVRTPLFLGSLTLTARYPRYLSLEDEPLPTTGDTLLLPVGTRLEAVGEATAGLRSAQWLTARDSFDMEVADGRFRGAFTPRLSGTYRLQLATLSGAALAGDPVNVPIRLIGDSAPQVEIPVPGADTTAATLNVPLVIDARDDHALRRLVLETRRVSRLGLADSVRRQELALPEKAVGRALVPLALNLKQLGLLPGDTLRYRAVVTDNAPAAQSGRSREYVLRLPTLSDLRAEQRQEANALGQRLDSLVAESRKVERAAEDLARAQPRDAARPGRTSEELSFDQARKAEAVAESQEELMRQAEETARALEQLQQAAEAAGIADSAWQQRMAELREQLERALSPELRQKLEELKQALAELNAERTKEALQRLAEAQKELREALERSRELFERAALEGDLANLAQESRELVQEQQRWNEQVAAADSAAAAAQQEVLAERADSLASALQQVGKAMPGEQQAQGLRDAAERARQASKQMSQAAKAARQGQRPQAKQRGEQAEQSLEPVAEQLDQQREELQDEWREEVMRALDQALAETGQLAERQLGVSQGFERGEPNNRMRAEQGLVEEGTARLLERMREVSGKNALVSPRIGAAMAAARLQMQKAREAVSSAAPNPREAAERAGEAVDALNVAAHALVSARGAVSGSQSGSGLQEALEQLAQMAGQQGQLGQQGEGLLPMMAGGGMQAQLAQLAAQQRALAERLERMRGTGNIPGAGEMAGEAKELARKLEAGRLDRETVERQERLFRRMLDAGRTLQGQEEDEQKERQSTAATGDSIHIPPALRRLIGNEDSALRMPTWDELQRLSPEDRRLVTDYFRRLTAPGTP